MKWHFISKDNAIKSDSFHISKLTILVIIAAVATGAAVVAWMWFAAASVPPHYDKSPLPGPWTNDNPLGFHAKVTYVLNPTGASCPIKPCKLAPMYMLKYASKETTFLLGYSICNREECINKEQLNSQALSDPGLIERSPELWSSLTLEGLDWKTGDTVNIKVILASAIIKSDGPVPDIDRIMNVDLGDSEIIQLERG